MLPTYFMSHSAVNAARSILALTYLLSVPLGAADAFVDPGATDRPLNRSPDLLRELEDVPYRLLYETYRNGNWELYTVKADGSDPVNLTRTPGVNELYPHASPDGTKVCFVVDEGAGAATIRSVHYMNMDGTARTLVARHARWPCWSPDGKTIAYLQSQFAPDAIATGKTGSGGPADTRFSYWDYATRGLLFYDLTTRTHRQHPNQGIHNLHNICWSPDKRWIVSTVHAGMGYSHANLAIAVDGVTIFDLGMRGCRPDLSPDGRRIGWSPGDFWVGVGNLDLSSTKPATKEQTNLVTTTRPFTIYHVDWSPDGKYLAFSGGPKTKRLGWHPALIGIEAKGWNIHICDARRPGRSVTITTDGLSNKEPDWIPLKAPRLPPSGP